MVFAMLFVLPYGTMREIEDEVRVSFSNSCYVAWQRRRRAKVM